MKVKLVGMRSGNSKKTQKAYVMLFFTYPQNGVEGVATDHLYIDPEHVTLPALKCGDQLEVLFNQRGYVDSVQLA